MTPSAPDLIKQAKTEPASFRWGLDPVDRTKIRAWIFGEPSQHDPVILTCTSKAVARLVIAEHNKGFAQHPLANARRW